METGILFVNIYCEADFPVSFLESGKEKGSRSLRRMSLQMAQSRVYHHHSTDLASGAAQCQNPMLSKSSKCVLTLVSEKVLLNVHLHSFPGKWVASWENSIYSDNVQHRANQVESALEIVVVYAHLID